MNYDMETVIHLIIKKITNTTILIFFLAIYMDRTIEIDFFYFFKYKIYTKY